MEALQINDGFGLFYNIQYTAFNHSSWIKFKLTLGIELFEEQYLKEQYLIVTRIEEGLNYLSTEIMYTACT